MPLPGDEPAGATTGDRDGFRLDWRDPAVDGVSQADLRTPSTPMAARRQTC